MSVTQLNSENFDSAIQKTGYHLVDFSADWCPPCKVMHPIMRAISEHTMVKSKVAFYEVDVDASADISARYNVRSIPTFILFYTDSNGVTVQKKQWTGAMPQDLFQKDIVESL